MIYYVYLLISKVKNRTISYVGYTNNLKKRIKLHNTNKGAKFTKGKKWKLGYFKKFTSKNKAMKYEYVLKKDYKFKKRIKQKRIN